MYRHDIMPIGQYINGLLRDRDRAEWSGDIKQADRIQKQIDNARDRQQAGEQWETLF